MFNKGFVQSYQFFMSTECQLSAEIFMNTVIKLFTFLAMWRKNTIFTPVILLTLKASSNYDIVDKATCLLLHHRRLGTL
jgi:uncharacterized membrane protein